MKSKTKSHVRRKKLGRIVEVDTGLDKLQFGAPNEFRRGLSPVENEFIGKSELELCRQFEDEARTVCEDDSQPEHVRALASGVLVNIGNVINTLEKSPLADKFSEREFSAVKDLLGKALFSGFFYGRMRIAPLERSAWRGTQAVKGAKSKNKRPKSGSIRAFLEMNFPGWQKQSVLPLARKLQGLPQFTGKNLEDIRRSINAAKKVGR